MFTLFSGTGRGMEFHRKERAQLGKLGINTVYLFGSRAQGCASTESDIDIAILLKEPRRSTRDFGKRYLEIYELLAEHFRTRRDIDIVFLHKASGQLKYHVVREGTVLYDADRERRKRFEEHTIIEHADFEYFRNLFETAILERAA